MGGDIPWYKREMVGIPKGGSAIDRAEQEGKMYEIENRVPRGQGEYKRGGRNWIAGAIKKPGALHRSLGVPQGQKIPASKLAKAAHSSNPTLRRRANLAKTLKKMH